MTHQMNPDSVRDAVAYLLASLQGDDAGRGAIVANCDPVELIDALTVMHLRALVALHLLAAQIRYDEEPEQ